MVMNESLPFLEIPNTPREQIVQAFQKFVVNGITRPDDLSLNDPEVIQANNLLDKWTTEQQVLAQQNCKGFEEK